MRQDVTPTTPDTETPTNTDPISQALVDCPDYAHHEQASEHGIAVFAGHGVPTKDATQGHPNPLYETHQRANNDRLSKPHNKGFDARYPNHEMCGGQ